MRIAINTSPMSSGHGARGIGLYTKELINALTEFESSHSYSFFTQPSEIAQNVDVIHYPFFDPFFLTLPWATKRPTVVTVHDLIPIVHASHFARGFRGEAKWQIQKRLLGQVAKNIITDSKASKHDIEKFLGFSHDHIFSVPLAPRAIFRPITSSNVKKKYGLSNKYVLYVGDVNWNKNVLGILDAFSQLAKISKNIVHLVLVGKAFVDSSLLEAIAIRKHIEHLGIKDLVTTPGFIPDNDLVGLYANAEALLYPSFAEGFGFPVLEAQASECPVVTSNVSSLVEIAGPAVQVDPHKIADIRRGLDVILSLSSEKRDEIVRKGRQWSSQFTWKRVAHETMKIYAKTFSNHTSI